MKKSRNICVIVSVILIIAVIVVAMTGCSDEHEMSVVNFHVVNSGDGLTQVKINDWENGYDTIQTLYDSSYSFMPQDKYQHVFRMWVDNHIGTGQFVHIISTISVDGEVMDRNVMKTGICGQRQILLRVTY